MEALNQLLGADVVDFTHDPASGELLWSYRSRKERGSRDFVENEIVKSLQLAGSMGLTEKELRASLTGQLKAVGHEPVTQAQLQGALKKMEKEGTIKSVKGQQSERRKVYLLSGEEPHPDVIGGTWEKDAASYDEIDVLMRKVYARVCHSMSAGAQGVSEKALIEVMKGGGLGADGEAGGPQDADRKRMI